MAKAELGLGDAFSFQDNYEQSLEHYKAAEAELASIDPKSLAKKNQFVSDFQELKTGLKKRFAADTGMQELERAKAMKPSAEKRKELFLARESLEKACQLAPKQIEFARALREADVEIEKLDGSLEKSD